MKRLLGLSALILLVAGIQGVSAQLCGNVTASVGTIEACPAGDGKTLQQAGLTITLQVFENGAPAVGVAPEHLYLTRVLTEPYGAIIGCEGSRIMYADAPTDENGYTTFTTAFAASQCCIQLGCPDNLWIGTNYLGGFMTDCDTGEILEIPINVRSVDLNLDETIDIVDLSLFAEYYPPYPYNTCVDFNGDGSVDVVDLSIFAEHFGPPGHHCP